MSSSSSSFVYEAGSIVASGNSGWLDISATPAAGKTGAISRVWFRLVTGTVSGTNPTLDVDLDLAFDSAGAGAVKVHDFTQITASDTTENLILPGGDSVDILIQTNGLTPAPMPKFVKFTWTIGGTSSPTFPVVIYAAYVMG